MTKFYAFSIDIPVSELMAERPETIPVFMRWQLGCVGCSMAPFDTVRDVAKIYKLSLEKLANDLDQAILTKASLCAGEHENGAQESPEEIKSPGSFDPHFRFMDKGEIG